MRWSNLRKRKCPICGELFTPTRRYKKYCQATCKYRAEKEKIRIRVHKHRQKHKHTEKQARYEAIGNATKEYGKVIMKQYHTGKGTGSLGAHPNPNFDEEQILIEKELKRLKVRP